VTSMAASCWTTSSPASDFERSTLSSGDGPLGCRDVAANQAPLPYLVLDLDDDECELSSHLSSLLEDSNDLEAANQLRAAQPQLRMLQKMLTQSIQCDLIGQPSRLPRAGSPVSRVSVHHLSEWRAHSRESRCRARTPSEARGGQDSFCGGAELSAEYRRNLLFVSKSYR